MNTNIPLQQIPQTLSEVVWGRSLGRYCMLVKISSYAARSCAKLGLKRTLLSSGLKIHSQGSSVSNSLRQKGRNRLIRDDLGPALWGYGFKKTQWGSSLSRNLSWIDTLIARPNNGAFWSSATSACWTPIINRTVRPHSDLNLSLHTSELMHTTFASINKNEGPTNPTVQFWVM